MQHNPSEKLSILLAALAMTMCALLAIGLVPATAQAKTITKIIDEDGRVVPLGDKGELCCRGYSVMQGYWDDEERTAETIDSAGWLHSGDLAEMDEEGYVSLPQGPGLGVEVDEAFAREVGANPSRSRPFAWPDNRLRDGSVADY